MPFQPFVTNQLLANHGVKVCVYGRGGVGKTRLVATAPRPYLISCEEGMLSLAGHAVQGARVKSFVDFIECYNWLTQSKDGMSYDTICLDSLSDLAELIISHELNKCSDGRAAYGKMSEKVIGIVRSIRDLPQRNVYLIAKEGTIDSGEGQKIVTAQMPGKKLNECGLDYYFDEFFRMAVDKNDAGVQYNYLLTQVTPGFTAKDRSGQLQPIERPDLSYIFTTIRAQQRAA